MNEANERPEEGAASEPEDQAQPEIENPTGATATDGPSGLDFGDFLEDAKRVLTDPEGFYRSMPTDGGLQRPLLFVIVMSVATAIVTTVLSLFGWGPIGAVGAAIVSIIFLPIIAVIGSYIAAAILYIIWTLMGSEQGYRTAYRCVAYTGAIFPITALFDAVPYLGSIVGIAWGMYLLVVASVEVHGRERQLAFTVFGIIGGLMIVGNVVGEYRSRQFGEQFENLGVSIEEQLEGLEDMTPEEAGQALGDFLRGLEDSLNEQQDEGE